MKLKKQRVQTGDIVRIKIADNRFVYGRVIGSLDKFYDYDITVDPELPVSTLNNISLFDRMISTVWMDFFVLITDNPNLKKEDLLKLKTTYSTFYSAILITSGDFQIIDSCQLDIDSFDVPMEIETYYQYVPVTQIFKWGPSVIKFKPDDRIEILTKERNKYNRRNCHVEEGIGYYVQSFIDDKPSFRTIPQCPFGDLRESVFDGLRMAINDNVGYDIHIGNYDNYAKKFGFMTKREIIDFINS